MNEEYDEEMGKTWAISSVPFPVIYGVKKVSLDYGWSHAVTLEQMLLAFESMQEDPE